jgi:hypothetical protein
MTRLTSNRSILIWTGAAEAGVGEFAGASDGWAVGDWGGVGVGVALGVLVGTVLGVAVREAPGVEVAVSKPVCDQICGPDGVCRMAQGVPRASVGVRTIAVGVSSLSSPTGAGRGVIGGTWGQITRDEERAWDWPSLQASSRP